MIENQFERFETGSLRIRSSLRVGIKVLPTVAMLGFVLFAAVDVSAQRMRNFPVLENEKLKELYIELVTIDAAMRFEKVSYPDLAVPGAEADDIRIVSMESALERYPGVFGNKDGSRVSRNEFGAGRED